MKCWPPLQVLNNKQTITAMVEAIQEAAALGMEATEVAVGIQARLDLCRNWELRAADFFTAPGRAPLSALEVDLVFWHSKPRLPAQNTGMLPSLHTAAVHFYLSFQPCFSPEKQAASCWN